MKYVLMCLMYVCCACTMLPFVSEQIEEAVIFEERAVSDELTRGHTISCRDCFRTTIWIDITLEGDVVLDSDIIVWPGPAFPSLVLKYDPHEMMLLPVV